MGELEARVCEAALSWGDQNLVISDAASELDIDAFGVDLGLGAPVVAAQVKKSKAECCMEYRHLFPASAARAAAAISPAESSSAPRTPIWMAASKSGRTMPLRWRASRISACSDLDFAPPVVLRFVRGRLLDASSEFRPYFDQKIADERAKLNPQDLRRFQKQRRQAGVRCWLTGRLAIPPAKRESKSVGNRVGLSLQRPRTGGLAFPRRDVARGGFGPDSRRALESARAGNPLPIGWSVNRSSHWAGNTRENF